MRSRKRRFQKGCLRQAKGSWVVKYYDALGVNRTATLGRAIGKQKISKNEAERLQSDFMRDINSKPAQSAMTFAQFVEKKFLPTRRDDVLKPVRPGTLARQEQRLNRYILPSIGSKMLAEIEQEDLLKVLRGACNTKTLGNEMLRKIRVDLMHVCRSAAAAGYITTPVWEKLPVPESDKQAAEKLTVTLPQYLEAIGALSERDRLACDLVTFVGLRPSEGFALQVGDLKADHIRIERSLYEGKINRVKTLESRRRIGVPAEIMARLRTYASGLPANGDTAWLFPSATIITPEWPDNAMDNRIDPALDAIGYGWLTFAILRRTFSTLHRAAGTDLDLIAYQQGHTKATHLDNYVQYAPAMMAAQLDKVYSKFLGLFTEANKAN